MKVGRWRWLDISTPMDNSSKVRKSNLVLQHSNVPSPCFLVCNGCCSWNFVELSIQLCMHKQWRETINKYKSGNCRTNVYHLWLIFIFLVVFLPLLECLSSLSGFLLCFRFSRFFRYFLGNGITAVITALV